MWQLDAGSPILLNGNQLGISSRSRCGGGEPVVGVDVRAYERWIVSHLWIISYKKQLRGLDNNLIIYIIYIDCIFTLYNKVLHLAKMVSIYWPKLRSRIYN